MITLRILVSLMLAAALSACASSGEYPSLAQRPAERAQGTFTPDTAAPSPPPPVMPSAELATRLAELQREAETAHGAFRSAAPAAERLANAAGATASDSWAAAQVALADLDSLRSRAAVALAELDALWIDATVEGGPRDAIGSVRGAVEALIAEEDAVLARLRARA